MTKSDQPTLRIPRHLAIIMDGNGRWAQKRHLPRVVGHHRGAEAAQGVVDECLAMGVGHLTLYAFSSENWGRPHDEVDALMGLLSAQLQRQLERLPLQRVRLRAIGELDRLPDKIRKVLDQVITGTAQNDEMTLTLALSYGGRNELIRAARALAHEVAAGRMEPEAIDEAMLAGALDTAGLPDPDLVIRTSGETRISNFMLWQTAYAEFIFLDVLWPDFSAYHLRTAFEEFARRERRFGLTGGQLATHDGGAH